MTEGTALGDVDPVIIGTLRLRTSTVITVAKIPSVSASSLALDIPIMEATSRPNGNFARIKIKHFIQFSIVERRGLPKVD